MAVDLPGHGETEKAEDFEEAAGHLGEAQGAAVYVGYSMGGRIALQLAVTHPATVEALVLIGVTAGIADGVDRAARLAADEELAAEIEQTPLRDFLERWLSQPMFTGLPPGEIDTRLSNTSIGLASTLRSMGTGAMKPLWNDLPRLEMPVLLVTGALDEKFTALATRMHSMIPNANRETIAGADHAAHIERPKEFARILEEFLVTRSIAPQQDGSQRSYEGGQHRLAARDPRPRRR